jgi:hypothetical protein
MHGLKETIWMNEEAQKFWEDGKQQSPTLRVGNLDFTDERFKAAWDKMLHLSVGGTRLSTGNTVENKTEREILEDLYGQVWDTDELKEEFTIDSFLAPFVIVKRKIDDVKGTMRFKHSPRFYFDFRRLGDEFE